MCVPERFLGTFSSVHIETKQLTAMLDTSCSKTVILRSAHPDDI
jgi:hypothetical protein